MEKGDYISNDSLKIKITDKFFQIEKIEDVETFLSDILLGDMYLHRYYKENNIEKIEWYRLVKDTYENKIELIKIGPEDEYLNYVISVCKDYEQIKKTVWQFRNEINKEIRESRTNRYGRIRR